MKRKIAYPILIILLLATVFQSFMLINYHSTGRLLPRRTIEGPNTVTEVINFEEYLLESYIRPFEITMTTGEGLNVNKVPRDLQGYFDQIWKDTISALATLADKKLYEIYDEDKWNEITGSAGYTIKLGYDCPIRFINWVTGSVNSNSEIDSINKIMVIPIDSDEGDVYIRSGNKVFRYLNVKLSGLLKQNEFLSLYDEIKQQSEITYVYLNEVALYENFKGNIEPDATVIIMDDYVTINRIRVASYEILSECMFNLQIEPDVNNLSPLVKQYISEIKTKLFGIYSDVYKEIIAQNRELTFSDQYNSYSIHTDGSLSYRYASASYIQEKGDISLAFSNALSMLTDMTSLSGTKQNNLVLTKVKEQDDSYTFSFTYFFNDYPVLMQNEKYSVVIKATADRVISMDANLYDITDASVAGSYVDLYDLRTFNMLSEQSISLGSLKADNMYIGYIKDEDTVLLPSWIIDDESVLVIELKEAED